MCFRLPTVPKFKSPTLNFLLSVLVFYNWFFSQKNVFSFKSVVVVTYIKTNFTKSVFVAFAHCRQHVSRDQTVSQWKWSSNEPWYHVTDWKCRYNSSVFIKSTSGKSKIISKNKIIIRPTYPNFKKHVTGNTHIFFVWPYPSPIINIITIRADWGMETTKVWSNLLIGESGY